MRRRPPEAAWLAIPVFVALYLVVDAVWNVPLWVAAVYLGVSILSFVLYAVDKRAARLGNRRTPESTLQLVALLGGWPGAIVGQQLLRHKTRKPRFLAVFWTVVVVNVALFALASYVTTPSQIPSADSSISGVQTLSRQPR